MSALKEIFQRYKTAQLIAAFFLFWTPVVIFAKIAGEVLEREPIPLDISILEYIHSLSNPTLDVIFLFFTTLGNAESVVAITIGLLISILISKRYMKALILTFSIGGAALANAILKLLFQRDRPSLWYSAIVEHSYSFPSGHAMVSSALIVCVLLLVWQTKWRIPATIGGLFLIFMIGLSRLYMGVHYPTDVIAGWSVGILWSLTVYAVVKGISYRLRSRKELVDEKK